MSFMDTRIYVGQVTNSPRSGRGFIRRSGSRIFVWYMLRYSDQIDGWTLTFHKSACQEMRTVNAVD